MDPAATFEEVCLSDRAALNAVFEKHKPTAVIGPYHPLSPLTSQHPRFRLARNFASPHHGHVRRAAPIQPCIMACHSHPVSQTLFLLQHNRLTYAPDCVCLWTDSLTRLCV